MSDLKSWRPDRDHFPPFGPHNPPKPVGLKAEEIPATKFFDNMSFIGDEWVGCFVIETSEGIIQIDCTEPDEAYEKLIEDGYKKLGLDITQLKYILISHGHADHWGCAENFRKKYGCKLLMSEIDEKAATEGLHFPQRMPRLDFKMDGYLEDGGVFTLGDTSIKMMLTPGHTVGSMSFIIPVYDEGRLHYAALWGGTGIPKEKELQEAYLASCDKFAAFCHDNNVDVEISTHPFIDATKERLALCRNICNGVANPFVIGVDAADRYQEMFRQLCINRIKIGLVQ